MYVGIYIHTHFHHLFSLPLPAGLGSDWSHGNCCVDADMTLGFTAPEVGVAKASAADEMTERKKVCTKSAFVFVSIICRSACHLTISLCLCTCVSTCGIVLCAHKSDVARDVRS